MSKSQRPPDRLKNSKRRQENRSMRRITSDLIRREDFDLLENRETIHVERETRGAIPPGTVKSYPRRDKIKLLDKEL